jgi:murein L,D-transpeptidase YafK
MVFCKALCMVRSTLFLLIIGCISLNGIAQNAVSTFNFIDYQRTFPRINEALKRKEDTLMKQFRAKNLPWPVKSVYLRSFKYDSQLEVWVRYNNNEKYRLFKTYKVCALAGSLGPKRMQGDYQVPEGFYYINEFNPRSAYHLSLGLNYPNNSDRILSDSLQPGGDIYIHGSCVTTGCIPIQDSQIEELYILAAHARNQGQEFIPVHIFPIQFKNQRSVHYLDKYLRDFPEYAPLVSELREAYTFFEKTRRVPIVMVNKNGRYILDGTINKEDEDAIAKPSAPVKKERPRKHFNDNELARSVDKLPSFPGGNSAFQEFIDKLSREMISFLEKDQKKTYVMMDFIIDKEGKAAYAKVLKGGNDALNEKLELQFEAMPLWTPAIKGEQTVAMRLKQSIVIEKPDAISLDSFTGSGN